MWFWTAAREFVEKWDVPNDHDGPRHFGLGFALMGPEVLDHIQRKDGNEKAVEAAERIVAAANQWLRENKTSS